MTPEGKLAAYLVRRCKELGLQQRKIHYEGRRGAPDRMVLAERCIGFVELKAPGKKARPEQVEEIEVLSRSGAMVSIADSKEGVEDFLRLVTMPHCYDLACDALGINRWDSSGRSDEQIKALNKEIKRQQAILFGGER